MVGPQKNRPRLLARDRLHHAVGVTADKHARWRKEGLLGDSPTAESQDALELAVLEQLIETVGPKRAKRAWEVIRPSLRKRAGSLKRAWAVVDKELERDGVAFTARELVGSAARGSLIWVIPLGETMDAARRAFDEHAAPALGDSS